MERRESFSVYFRGRFNFGNGVEPIPRDDKKKLFSENPRGREDITVICEAQSYEKANPLALAEAKRRNVVLYEERFTPDYSFKVSWHPKGWRPASSNSLILIPGIVSQK